MLEVIKCLQLSNKSNFFDVRDLPIKENITSKDVRFHHRICDAQKHLVHGTGNFINLSWNQGELFEQVLEVIKDLQMSKKIEFYRFERLEDERKHDF